MAEISRRLASCERLPETSRMRVSMVFGLITFMAGACFSACGTGSNSSGDRGGTSGKGGTGGGDAAKTGGTIGTGGAADASLGGSGGAAGSITSGGGSAGSSGSGGGKDSGFPDVDFTYDSSTGDDGGLGHA